MRETTVEPLLADVTAPAIEIGRCVDVDRARAEVDRGDAIKISLEQRLRAALIRQRQERFEHRAVEESRDADSVRVSRSDDRLSGRFVFVDQGGDDSDVDERLIAGQKNRAPDCWMSFAQVLGTTFDGRPDAAMPGRVVG